VRRAQDLLSGGKRGGTYSRWCQRIGPFRSFLQNSMVLLVQIARGHRDRALWLWIKHDETLQAEIWGSIMNETSITPGRGFVRLNFGDGHLYRSYWVSFSPSLFSPALSLSLLHNFDPAPGACRVSWTTSICYMAGERCSMPTGVFTAASGASVSNQVPFPLSKASRSFVGRGCNFASLVGWLVGWLIVQAT
jgi:hypothetical protein